MDFLNLIQENILSIIAALSAGNILVFIASIVKVFSQKNLNKAFEMFSLGSKDLVEQAKGLLDKNIDIETKVKLLTDAINQIETTIKTLAEEVQKLNSTELFEQLATSLKELETIKATIDYKDKLIEAYQADIQQIRIELMKLEGKGGYDELLQTKQKT